MGKKNRNIPQMRGGPVQPKFVPNYTEEQRMTIEKATKIVADEEAIIAKANDEKTKILADAAAENSRLHEENERLKKEINERSEESQRILESYGAQKETLRLNEDAQAVIDSAEELHVKAQAKAKEVEDKAAQTAKETISRADKEAEDKLKKATEEARQIVEKAREDAEALAEKKRVEAEERAKEILDAALKEEQRIVDRQESIASLAAESVRNAADDYSKRVREKADDYMVRMRAQADQTADQIVKKAEENAEQVLESAQQLIDSQTESNRRFSEKLHADEVDLNTRRANIPSEVQRMVQERTYELETKLAAQRDELSRKEGELTEKEDGLAWERESLEEEKRAFSDRLAREVTARHGQLESELKAAREHERDLLNANTELQRQVNTITESYKKLRGADAAQIQDELQRAREELRVIHEYGIRAENAKAVHDAQEENVALREKNIELGRRLTEANNALALSAGTEEKLSAAISSSDTYQRMVEDLMRKLDERKSVSRSQMLLPIQEPPKFLSMQRADRDPEKYKDEVAWLDHILAQSRKSGIILSSRFLYAYHTSLKIGEWSPLVVLAGVSGTGKSELPKQYAHHGGMHFLSVPVKPDWDSPASLFGYFNAIENRFEATELLRALYQMQEERKDDMFVVLLDEMNLAHPEQYFADLLSKFEENRGSDLPAEYDILLGAGEPPEKLSIARNVLWTGTMNEDETTKGLSDKVIDRSMLITFPCPKELHDRDNTRIQEPELTLSRQRWEEWKASALSRTANSGLTKRLEEKKAVIQQINGMMSIMGRNLGHRVWQSIENYILNYPSVIATGGHPDEIDKAFCDAVAFKMMPKLRGLETRGSNEDQLNAIRNVLPEQLRGDFKKACDQTSEVFRWNSADFMED